MGAVQAPVADKALTQVAVVDQRLAQPGANGEHHNSIMNQKLMLLQQAQQIGRSRFGQPFKLIDRRIGIWRARKQSRKCLLNSRRHELVNVSEASPGRFRIAKLHVRGEHYGIRLGGIGRRNKMRTVLTMLGIIIGVGAVIAMVGIGNGAKAQVQARIAALGQNVIMVFACSINRGGVYSGSGGAGTLTVEDALAIEKEVSGVSVVSPEVRSSAQIMAGNNNWSTSVMGEGVGYLTLRVWDLEDGSMFTDADVRAAAKVCILGKTTADHLFPEEDPVGKTIRIKNVPMKVLGLLKAKGASMFGSDQDDTVIVPYTTGMKR